MGVCRYRKRTTITCRIQNHTVEVVLTVEKVIQQRPAPRNVLSWLTISEMGKAGYYYALLLGSLYSELKQKEVECPLTLLPL